MNFISNKLKMKEIFIKENLDMKIYMELNLENDLILDYIYQLHKFVYEHLFRVNQIIPIKINLFI